MASPSRAAAVRRRAVGWGAASLLAVAALQLASFVGPHRGSAGRMARLPDGATPGFDGQFFAALADDPLVGPPTAARLDLPVVRATRIAYPLAAHLLAPLAGGTLPGLLLLQTLSIAAIVAVVQLAAVETGASPALAPAVALLLPFVLSVELVTAEAPAAAAVLWAAWAERRGHRRAAAAALAAACLTKEVALLAVAAFALAALLQRRRRDALLHAAAGLPVVLWHLHLVARLGSPSDGSALLANLQLPGLGAWRAAVEHGRLLASGGAGADAAGLLAALAWYLAGVVLAARSLRQRAASPGALLAAAGAALALLLSQGPASRAFDEVFNFGRQLFLLPVGAVVALRFEAEPPSAALRRALTLWLAAGALLGLGWWLHAIAST